MDEGKEPIWLRMTIAAVFCFAVVSVAILGAAVVHAFLSP
jgi:hypothetical protein